MTAPHQPLGFQDGHRVSDGAGLDGEYYPSLMAYNATQAELELSAGRLMDMVGSGKVKIDINQRYALADAVQAHKDLEGRKTTGSTVILP